MLSLLPRRSFLAATSAGGGLFGLAACRAAAAAAEPTRPEIVAFSKPFIDRSFEETADLVADVGWDGIECPVRDGTSTHVAPSRVEEDLPKMVEALRRRGKSIAIVTTSVVGLDAAGEKVLRTAAALGIRRARLGFMKYPRDQHPTKGVAELRARLADVVALARETGIRLGYQNHSGADYVGAPIWDVWEAIKEYDPAQIGTCFDVGHAAIEGGLSWPVQARLMADRLTAVYCKDFFWNRTAKGQELRWCPLGDGVMPRAFFGWLRTTGFRGPISQHHEYDLGTGPEMIAHFKRDLETLRGWLAA